MSPPVSTTDRYPPIGDYALIGDCHSAALVSRHGSIDWACLPRFDSPAVFLKILDENRGGCCSIEAEGLRYCTRRYLDGTNILETSFHTAGGAFTVTDFMPVSPRSDKRPHGQDVENEERIVRLFRCERGEARFQVRIHPTFDFARAQAAGVRREGNNFVLTSGRDSLHVHLDGAFEVSEDNGAITARVRLAEEEQASVVPGSA